jgi:hypothetical protein
MSPWYKTAKECLAIRKNVLRVDLCVFIDKEEQFTNEDYLNSTIKSILTSAIINGLDIIGVLSADNPTVGLRAQQMSIEQKMDLVVVPGQTYVTRDNESLYIYNLTTPMPQNLTLDKACEFAHKKGGFVMVANVSRAIAQKINRLQGSLYAPDAVEVFNAQTGGYRDIDIDFPRFVSSGATSASDLEETNVFTLLERKKAVEMGFIHNEQGVDYTPKYLLPKTGEI